MKNSLLRAGTIASLVMAMAASAVCRMWYSRRRISVRKIGGRISSRIVKRITGEIVRRIAEKTARQIGRRIVAPTVVDAAGKRIGLEMKRGAHDSGREPLFFRFKRTRCYRCRLPWASCFSRAIWREARSCAWWILACSLLVTTPSDLALSSILLICPCCLFSRFASRSFN